MRSLKLGMCGLLVLTGCAATPTPAPRVAAAAVAPALKDHEKPAPVRDPAQPEYWVARLGDPARFHEAYEHLQSLVDAASQGDDDAIRLALATRISALAIPVYLEHAEQLPPTERGALMKLVARGQAPAAGAAFRHALDAYLNGRRPEPTPRDVDVALRRIAEQQIRGLAPQVLRVFVTLRASSEQGQHLRRSTAAAMTALAERSWLPLLTQKIAEPMPPSSDEDALGDQLFWQATAAETLGKIGQPAALEPLLNVIFDPSKKRLGEAAYGAALELAPTQARATQLLHDRQTDRARVGANLLGRLGRADAAPELIAAAKRARTPEERYHIGYALSQLPPSPPVLTAFKATFDAVPSNAGTAGPNSLPIRLMLANVATNFSTPELVSWLVDRAQRAHRTHDVSEGDLLEAALMLASPEQLPSVEPAVGLVGDERRRKALSGTHEIVTQCVEAWDCYARAVVDPAHQSHFDYVSIKAAYMLGVLGHESDVPRLLTLLDELAKTGNSTLCFLVGKAIDHVLPNGSPTASATLAVLIHRRHPPGPNDHLTQLLRRLHAREKPASSPPG